MAKPKITFCMGSSCFARGNERNLALCEDFLAERALQDEVDVELAGSLCTGNCANGPVVIVDGVTHTRVDREMMQEILNETFKVEGEG